MAEAILFDIGKNILSQLSSHAVQEIGRWWNVEKEFEKLERTVRTIQAVLIDAEDDERELCQQFKHWLVELRRVLYDAEEVVDDFATEALRRRAMTKSLLPMEVRLFFSSSNQLLHGNKMANRIKEIREALDDITNDRQKFHFSVYLSEASRKRSGMRDLFKLDRENVVTKLDQDKVFGREHDRDEIVGLLKSDSEHKVISIVGSGGLGKTSLAKLVSDEVGEYFELRMWVFVGDVDFRIGEIAKKATNSAVRKMQEVETKESKMREVSGGAKREGVEGDEIKVFKKLIHGKKFLLVLDDVWSEDHNKWADLKDLWRDCRSDSVIIVTSRSVDVAKMIRSELYSLGYLSPSDSWSLFVKIVFGGKEPENKEVLENGKKIVAKCGGVPLAIKTIGNMLYSLNPETEWLPYVTNELLKYPQANNNIFPTLRLSYDNLPSPLKYCFAYCSLFPKGYIIDVEILILLWIAQGYIKPSEMGESLEDIGLQYYKILVSRSFFEVERVDMISGDLIRCKMHDMMHDLASLVAGDEIARSNSDGKYINKHTRHLNICGLNFSRSCQSMLKAKRLRTFVSSFGDQYQSNVITPDECGKMFKNFTSLLALDLSELGVAFEIPKSIGRLKHLRYLDLSGQKMRKLPKSITKLYNLQMLKLNRCSNLIKLPKDIQKLISLRYLDCSRCDNLTHLPQGLEELLELWYLNCSWCDKLTSMPLGLEKLVNLRYLNCHWCDSLTYMPRGLKKLSSLRTLTMFAVALGGSRRSKHMACLDELRDLDLRGKLEIKGLGDMEIDESEFQDVNLKQKHHLLSLFLKWRKDLKNQIPTSDENILKWLEPHSNLKQLEIDGYGGISLPNWFAVLHRLVSLELCDCKSCQYLPPLGGLGNLKNLTIKGCDDLMYIDTVTDGLPQLGTWPTAFFPSLESLIVHSCRKLKGWWNVNVDNYDELPQFPRLSSLDIRTCPNLTCMPLFPTLNDKLFLENTSIEPFQQTLKATVPTSTTSSSTSLLVHPLSNLKDLTIGYMKDLTYLPEEGMQQLTSVKTLEIRGCPHLSETCGSKDGCDWHKISHIPNITVNYKSIQIDGHLQRIAGSPATRLLGIEINED